MSTEPANPYNIDHAKEQRLKRYFVILIALGFLAALLFIGIGFGLDAILSSDPVDPPTPPAIQDDVA